jgi:hypothetical protein
MIGMNDPETVIEAEFGVKPRTKRFPQFRSVVMLDN